MSRQFRIRRFYFKQKKSEIVREGLTLRQAQKHCCDPETSSRTATSVAAQQITAQHGPWFDGFEETA